MTNTKSTLAAAIYALALLLASGCQNRSAPSSPTPTSHGTSEHPTQVTIDNFSFTPATLTIAAGATVTWINHDDVPHTVTSTDKKFSSKALDTDDAFSHAFTQPGTYSYFCAVHPHMTGTVIVK